MKVSWLWGPLYRGLEVSRGAAATLVVGVANTAPAPLEGERLVTAADAQPQTRETLELAREVLEWLDQNEQGMFNICCQRCNAPFEHSGQPVAAPAEWYGGLTWERQLAEALSVLAARLDAAEHASRTRADYDLRCQDCGAPHWFDTSLPSEVWNQVAKPEDLLCLLCIDARLAAAGIETDQAEFYFVGKALLSKQYAEDTGTIQYERARAVAAEKERDEACAVLERFEDRYRDGLVRRATTAASAFEYATLRADTAEARLEAATDALAFWVDRADRFEAELPSDRQYTRARGVRHDSYATGRAAARAVLAGGRRRVNFNPCPTSPLDAAGDEQEERVASSECDGSSECFATLHIHGCFSDDGKNCDHPSEHPAAGLVDQRSGT